MNDHARPEQWAMFVPAWPEQHFGTNGDFEKALQLYREYDGKEKHGIELKGKGGFIVRLWSRRDL